MYVCVNKANRTRNQVAFHAESSLSLILIFRQAAVSHAKINEQDNAQVPIGKTKIRNHNYETPFFHKSRRNPLMREIF